MERLVTILLAAGLAASAHAAPKMVLRGGPVFDAGEVWRPAPVEHAFVVENAGDEDLTLSVKPACGCTLVDHAKVVAPGKTGTITLSLATERFLGPVRKTAVVTSNDPSQPTVQLAMSATIRAHVAVAPSESIALRRHVGEDARQAVTITADGGRAMTITGVTASDPRILHALTRSADGKGWELTAWIAPDAPAGNFRGTLTLATDVKEQPEVSVTVTAAIAGAIEAAPSSLFLKAGAGTGPATVSRSLGLAHWKGEDFEVTSSRVADGGLPAGALDVTIADRTVTVDYKGGLPAGSYQGEIVLTTTDDEAREIRVPVYLSVS